MYRWVADNILRQLWNHLVVVSVVMAVNMMMLNHLDGCDRQTRPR